MISTYLNIYDTVCYGNRFIDINLFVSLLCASICIKWFYGLWVKFIKDLVIINVVIKSFFLCSSFLFVSLANFVNCERSMRMARIIYTSNSVDFNELIQKAYRMNCQHNKIYINIGNGYCVDRSHPYQLEQSREVKLRPLQDIVRQIISVYNQDDQLIFKRNRKGQLVKVRYG